MIDETEAWRVSGDGRTVTSGAWSDSGPVVRALCHDAETAEHIVRLHNDARQDGAFTVRLRPTFGTHGSSIGEDA